eukprot:gene8138-5672_t
MGRHLSLSGLIGLLLVTWSSRKKEKRREEEPRRYVLCCAVLCTTTGDCSLILWGSIPKPPSHLILSVIAHQIDVCTGLLLIPSLAFSFVLVLIFFFSFC